MAEGYIDLSPIIRAVNTVNSNVISLGHDVDRIDARTQQIEQEVVELQQTVAQMIKEQRLQAAYQRAITEVIRVRQEVDEKFGTHKMVRETLLGILDISDKALVSEATISRCTEELMLTAPKYWLAPSLIAIAAWIAGSGKGVKSKERELAIRAVNEAIKRDKEKTCLLFALICRRNQREKACFAWLSEYFSCQSALKTKKSVIAVLEAYTNNVFGEDQDGICEGYIDKWINELKGANPDFDQEQKAYWKDWFTTQGKAAMYNSEGYQMLQALAPNDFGKINNFVARITALTNKGGIRDQIKGKLAAEVNLELLKQKIDLELRKLITNYEEGEEAQLRTEEEYLQLVKEEKGNEEVAKAKLKLRQAARRDDPVDFVARIRAIVGSSSESVAAQKMSILLLKPYIVDAYNEYADEWKEFYPEEIGLVLQDKMASSGNTVKWGGRTANGENVEDLKKSIFTKYATERDAAVLAAKPTTAKMVIVGIFTLGLGCIFLNKKFKAKKAEIETEYNKKAQISFRKVQLAITGRQEANSIVEAFNNAVEDYSFIQVGDEPVQELVAAPVEEVAEVVEEVVEVAATEDAQ